MKKIQLLMMMLATGVVFNSTAKPVSDPELNFAKKDTVEILFGNNSKIIVVVDSKDDLEKIQQYDVNAMLKELNLKLEENSKDKDVLVIEDKSGKRYLKDTSIVYEDPEFREMEDEFNEEFSNHDDDEYAYQDEDNDSDGDNSDDWWKNHRYNNEKSFSGKKTTHRSVVDFGMNNYLQDGSFPDEDNQPYTVKPFGSWYVALGSTFQTHIAGPLALEWGGNVSWYNFKYQDPSQVIMEGANSVEWAESTMPNPAKSKLTVTYINASLVPVFDFGYDKKVRTHDDGSQSKYLSHDNDKFRIGFGGYVGYKVDSYSKFVYKDDGKNKDHNKDSFYLENLRYGLRFVTGFDDVDLFINYDLNNLFHENRGPQLNAFSFGISF